MSVASQRLQITEVSGPAICWGYYPELGVQIIASTSEQMIEAAEAIKATRNKKFAIWKYELEPDVNEIVMPKGAVCLSVGVQEDRPKLWARVELETGLLEIKKILVLGTGNDFPGYEFDSPAKSSFIGTVILYGGSLVLHVFDITSGEVAEG